MNKFQSVNFKSIEDFLDYLPEEQLKVVEFLRQLIHECIPNVKEKLSYNVPYFSKNKRIVYIWPAAVPWGMVPLNGVQLGFCYGNLLSDEINYLAKGNRKQVFYKTFSSIDEIDVDLIKMYLFGAVEVDKGFVKH